MSRILHNLSCIGVLKLFDEVIDSLRKRSGSLSVLLGVIPRPCKNHAQITSSREPVHAWCFGFMVFCIRQAKIF